MKISLTFKSHIFNKVEATMIESSINIQYNFHKVNKSIRVNRQKMTLNYLFDLFSSSMSYFYKCDCQFH